MTSRSVPAVRSSLDRDGIALDVRWCRVKRAGGACRGSRKVGRQLPTGCSTPRDFSSSSSATATSPSAGDQRLASRSSAGRGARRHPYASPRRLPPGPSQVAQLTWNSFRDHLILEYEIPKWDGDLGRPNLYQPLRQATLERKIELLNEHFGTQRSKDWFDAETFRALARLRGMESRAPERAAEAFVMSKALLGLGSSYVQSTREAPEFAALHTFSSLLRRQTRPRLKV